MLTPRFYLRASLTSGFFHMVGDILAQNIEARTGNTSDPSLNPPEEQQQQQQLPTFAPLDLQRTAKFGLTGFFLHGPYFATVFHTLDRLFSGPTPIFSRYVKWITGSSTGRVAQLKLVASKVLFSQVTFFPLYIVSFLSFTAMLDRNTWPELKEKIAKAFVPTFVMGQIWVPVNLINFTVFPPGNARLVFINLVGIGWGSYLSHVNKKYGMIVTQHPHQNADEQAKLFVK